MLQRILARNETLVSLMLVAFCPVTAWLEPSFLSLPTLFDLLRNGMVMAMFAVGVLLVLASGGIDVSFTAIAAFAMYVGTKAMIVLRNGRFDPRRFPVAGAIGLGLGLINGFFIATLRLPTLIVTLGTLSVFRGFLLTFVGTQLITAVPIGMRDVLAHHAFPADRTPTADRLAANRLSAGRRGRGADLRSCSTARCSGGASMRSAARPSWRFASA